MTSFISAETQAWILANGWTMTLGAMVFIQWIGLQVLAVHYYNFKKSLRRPKPDQIRFNMIEKAVAFQHEQIESIFTKLSEFRKEVATVGTMGDKMMAANATRKSQNEGPSLESTYVSLGELNLKKRLSAMKAEDQSTSVRVS